jgi:hypothetical protein
MAPPTVQAPVIVCVIESPALSVAVTRWSA